MPPQAEQLNSKGTEQETERQPEEPVAAENLPETPEDLNELKEHTTKQVEETSRKAITSGTRLIEAAVTSAGGRPEEIETGKSAIASVQGEIKDLAIGTKTEIQQAAEIKGSPLPQTQEEDLKLRLRGFSKNFSPAERKETAIRIREERKIYFSRNNELSERISKLAKEKEASSTSIEQLDSELTSIEKELLEREQSSMQRLSDYIGMNRRMKELRGNLGTKGEERSDFQEQFTEAQTTIEDLESAKLDRQHLEAAKDILSGFYKGQEEKLSQFMKEQQEIRDVSNISKKNQSVFIHGIHPTFVPDQNSLLNRNVDWQTKLDVFLAFNPTISTSTIKRGDAPNRMWARQGVIIKDGFVLSASSDDAGSVAANIEDRSGWSYSRKMTDDDVHRAIYGRGNRYNEFIVANPKIAGFFICREESRLPDLAPLEEIISECESLGIPIFEIKNGQVWETKPSSDGRDLEVLNPLTPEELSQKECSLPEIEREKIEQKILNNSPFNVWPSEAKYIASRARGRELYISFNRKKYMDGDGREEVFSDPALERSSKIKKGSKIKVLDEFTSVGRKIRYLATDTGKLYRHTILSYRPESKLNPQTSRQIREVGTNELREISDYDMQRDTQGSSGVYLAFNYHNIGQSLDNMSSYLDGMEKSLKTLIEKSEADVKGEKNVKAKERLKKFYNEWIYQLIFHLYGFAEEAKQRDDFETERRALEIVGTVTKPEYCKEVLDTRLDSEGRFRIKKEEISK